MRLTVSFLLAALIGFGQGCQTSRPNDYPAAGNERITSTLKPIALRHAVPALAAAVVTDSGDITVGVVGVRDAKGHEPVTVDDRWHLGSCGKAMTATVIARLVEQGRLKWDTTVADVFPELAPGFKSKLGDVTVTQLLSHRAGLPHDANYRRLRNSGSATQQRWEAVKLAGARHLLHAPGSCYAYSNLGYIIAGAMIERVTGRSYEEAMREHLFIPLGMTSAVFESPQLVGASQVPRSHTAHGRVASPSRIASFNPEVLRPAGCIRCSMEDWAKFLLQHLRGSQSDSDFLRPESYQRLHTPPADGEYALGWTVHKTQWANGAFLAHNGSNRLNFCEVLVVPQRGFAVLVCCNQDGADAVHEATGTLVELFMHGERFRTVERELEPDL